MGMNKQPGQTLYARLGASYIQMHAVKGHIFLSCYDEKGLRLWSSEIEDNHPLWDGKGWDVLKIASMFNNWEMEIANDNENFELSGGALS